MRVLPVLDEEVTHPVPDLPSEEHGRMLRAMLLVRLLDEKLLLLQRQGRIAFFGPFSGQEAAICGSGASLQEKDWVFPALREAGILLMRGFPLERYLGQLFGNSLDVQKGHQQPMHFSSKEHRFLSLSSVIGTQIPQAVGAARAAALRGEDVVTYGYMGDGATSSTDFHAAMNFAAVWKAPCVLVCQNNQWAISVPFEKQTASQGIAIKARAYGMPGLAVDGNDVLAVREACLEARSRAARGEGPTLLELVTYRRGGHSSSDDPTRYRDEDLVAPWLREDPIERYTNWLVASSLWDEERDQALRSELQKTIDEAIRRAEAAPAPEITTLFEDVYASEPPHLRAQRAQVAPTDKDHKIEGAFPL